MGRASRRGRGLAVANSVKHVARSEDAFVARFLEELGALNGIAWDALSLGVRGAKVVACPGDVSVAGLLEETGCPRGVLRHSLPGGEEHASPVASIGTVAGAALLKELQRQRRILGDDLACLEEPAKIATAQSYAMGAGLLEERDGLFAILLDADPPAVEKSQVVASPEVFTSAGQVIEVSRFPDVCGNPIAALVGPANVDARRGVAVATAARESRSSLWDNPTVASSSASSTSLCGLACAQAAREKRAAESTTELAEGELLVRGAIVHIYHKCQV